MGNSIHNDSVYEGKEIDLIVKGRVARKVKSAAITQYVPCKHCRACIKSNILWSHKKSCRKSRESIQRKGKRRAKERRTHLPLAKNIFHLLAIEIRKMRPDFTTIVAKSDKHLLEVGHRQLNQSNSFRARENAYLGIIIDFFKETRLQNQNRSRFLFSIIHNIVQQYNIKTPL